MNDTTIYNYIYSGPVSDGNEVLIRIPQNSSWDTKYKIQMHWEVVATLVFKS